MRAGTEYTTVVERPVSWRRLCSRLFAPNLVIVVCHHVKNKILNRYLAILECPCWMKCCYLCVGSMIEHAAAEQASYSKHYLTVGVSIVRLLFFLCKTKPDYVTWMICTDWPLRFTHIDILCLVGTLWEPSGSPVCPGTIGVWCLTWLRNSNTYERTLFKQYLENLSVIMAALLLCNKAIFQSNIVDRIDCEH